MVGLIADIIEHQAVPEVPEGIGTVFDAGHQGRNFRRIFLEIALKDGQFRSIGKDALIGGVADMPGVRTEPVGGLNGRSHLLAELPDKGVHVEQVAIGPDVDDEDRDAEDGKTDGQFAGYGKILKHVLLT